MGSTDDFDEMRKSINRMLDDAFRSRRGAFEEPFVYGFTVRSSRVRRGVPRRLRIEVPEPEADDATAEIVEGDETLFVTLDLPDQETPRVVIEGRRMVIHGQSEPLVIDLPDEVASTPISVSQRNGVLDVTLQKTRRSATVQAE